MLELFYQNRFDVLFILILNIQFYVGMMESPTYKWPALWTPIIYQQFKSFQIKKMNIAFDN